MADVIYNRNIIDNDRKCVTSLIDISDGTGYSAQMIDVGNLNKNSLGQTCNRIALQKLSYDNDIAAAANPIQLQWNVGGGDNVPLFTLGEGYNQYDFTSFGGITNSEATNVSGDVWIVIPAGIATGETVTIITEWIKFYE